jgi:hypothetical protein
MDTLTAKSEATYATILEAALAMAAEEGIGKLSLGDWPSAPGLVKAGYFPALVL